LATRFRLKSIHHEASIQSKEQAHLSDLLTCSTSGRSYVTIIVTINLNRKRYLSLLILVMKVFSITIYCNENCDVVPHRQYCTITGHYMVPAVYCAYWPDDRLISIWNMSPSLEREYKLCFDWWFVWLWLMYNTTGCVPLGFIYSSTYSILKLPVPQTATRIDQYKQPHLKTQTKPRSTCCNAISHCLILFMTVSYCLRFPVSCSIHILNKITNLSNKCNTSYALF
jgi:hypothetical protein